MAIEFPKNVVDSSYLRSVRFFQKKGEKKIKHARKEQFFSFFLHKKKLKFQDIFFGGGDFLNLNKNTLVWKYAGQHLVNFLYHTNMPKFHYSIPDENTTP